MKDLKNMTVEEFAMLDEVYGSEGLGANTLVYSDENIEVEVEIPDEVNEAAIEENRDVWESEAMKPIFKELQEKAIEEIGA